MKFCPFDPNMIEYPVGYQLIKKYPYRIHYGTGLFRVSPDVNYNLGELRDKLAVLSHFLYHSPRWSFDIHTDFKTFVINEALTTDCHSSQVPFYKRYERFQDVAYSMDFYDNLPKWVSVNEVIYTSRPLEYERFDRYHIMNVDELWFRNVADTSGSIFVLKMEGIKRRIV